MALIGISYDVGLTVAPLPDQQLVLILTRKRVIEGGAEAGIALRAAFGLLFNSDPLQSQSGDSIDVSADLGSSVALEATLAIGITEADRQLKNDLIASVIVGDSPGAKSDLKRIFLSPRPFEIGLAAGIEVGIGGGTSGGVGHEVELVRAQGRFEELPSMLDALLRQATGETRFKPERTKLMM